MARTLVANIPSRCPARRLAQIRYAAPDATRSPACLARRPLALPAGVEIKISS
jgi:hypothetical protein